MTIINDKPSHEQIAAKIDEERIKWQRRFEQKHRTPKKYDVNDLVVIEHVPVATGESRKLEPKYRGPYIITKVLDMDRYIVADLPDCQRNQRHFESVYTSDKLKPWCTLGPETNSETSDEDGNDEN